MPLPYDPKLEAFLLDDNGRTRRIYLIHRLDQDTSGVLLLAFDAELAAQEADATTSAAYFSFGTSGTTGAATYEPDEEELTWGSPRGDAGLLPGSDRGAAVVALAQALGHDDATVDATVDMAATWL